MPKKSVILELISKNDLLRLQSFVLNEFSLLLRSKASSWDVISLVKSLVPHFVHKE